MTAARRGRLAGWGQFEPLINGVAVGVEADDHTVVADSGQVCAFREPALSLGEQATGVTRSIPDLAPMWWMRISVVPVHIPPARPWFARNSLMISLL